MFVGQIHFRVTCRLQFHYNCLSVNSLLCLFSYKLKESRSNSICVLQLSHLCTPSSQHCSLPSLSILCSRLHMEDVCNAVLLVWSSLRLTPIRSLTLQRYQLKNYLINPDWLVLVLAEEHFHHLGVGTTKHQGETGIRNIVRFSTCVVLIIKQTTEWPGQ